MCIGLLLRTTIYGLFGEIEVLLNRLDSHKSLYYSLFKSDVVQMQLIELLDILLLKGVDLIGWA